LAEFRVLVCFGQQPVSAHFCAQMACVCSPESHFFRCAAQGLGTTKSWDLSTSTRLTPRRNILAGILPILSFQ
jgi:hypothetical protein